MRPSIVPSAGSAACLVVALLVAGACVDDDGDPSDDGLGTSSTTVADEPSEEGDEEDGSPWPGDGSPTETHDLGAGLVAELPEGWEVTTFSDTGDVPGSGADSGCTAQAATLASGDHHVELQLNATGCTGVDDGEQIGNGYHGTYVTVDDAPDPRDVAEHEVAAGALTTFSQDYFECTNECNDYVDTVGLLALDDPPDPELPTLMLVSPRGELSADRLVAVADAIHPEAG